MKKDVVAMSARVLLAAIFVISGLGKIGGFDDTTSIIASKGLPVPALLTSVTIVVELVGGILLAIGWKARRMALVLAAFTVVATVIFHAFWTDLPEQVLQQQTLFLKNLAIIGGLLLVWVHGPGRISVERKERLEVRR